MWSDNDIDNAFHRLNPPDPEPAPFSLDAWLRLETQLDEAVIERAVRRRVWRFFAVEITVVALAVLSWLLWPGHPAGPTPSAAAAAAAQSRATRAAAPSGRATAANVVTVSGSAVGPALAKAGVRPVGAAAGTRPRRLAAGAAIAAQPERTPSPQPTAESQTRRGAGAVVGIAAAPAAREKRPDNESKAAFSAHRAAVSPAAAPVFAGALPTSAGKKEATKHPASAPEPRRQRTAASARPGPGKAALAARQAPRSLAPATAAGRATGAKAGAADPTERLTPSASIAALTARLVAVRPLPAVPLPVPLGAVAVADAPPARREAPALARQPRFYMGLVGAPDVSTVKFASIESPLLNAGVTLEYRLTDRMRISTGLLRSKKQYLARRADYNFGAYAAMLTHRYFDDVDGTCTVLDVPLNVRYDLTARPRYSLFGSAGLSSFFMQRERYSYAYVEYNKPGYWEGEVVNQNRHFLGILNLSLGYERRLGTRWGLQAEPYLKLPLAGVGAGQLKLTSAGVFLGVKYGF